MLLRKSIEKPSGEFFETLGQYVYMYKDPNTDEFTTIPGTNDYIGKGNGDDRCWSHVADKGFDPANLYIMGRNLERFEDKVDGPAFAVESFAIQLLMPRKNRVSGHYKECYPMAKLSEMFSEYISEQHDNFESFPDWYVENYHVFRGKMREVKINAGTFFVLSNARNAMYMMFYYNNNDPKVKVTFEINKNGKELEHAKGQLTQWLNANGYDEVFPDGKEQKMAVNCETIDDVIKLFEEFMG